MNAAAGAWRERHQRRVRTFVTFHKCEKEMPELGVVSDWQARWPGLTPEQRREAREIFDPMFGRISEAIPKESDLRTLCRTAERGHDLDRYVTYWTR